ncbi:hypothetical protein HK414_23525 [Ramlibacter terrae]|uniref:Uncharacterized protein n=1 Tax=Ramlibacter terrae TaxID=2732511 RepID=A0ABX6P599_9BURK|nr:hypothetical protein HK414_23525 [Ramlibacter terrae]
MEEDPDAAAGSTRDPLLNAALFHIDNGSCPAAGARSAQSSAAPQLAPSRTPSRPARSGRLLWDQR